MVRGKAVEVLGTDVREIRDLMYGRALSVFSSKKKKRCWISSVVNSLLSNG